MKYPPHFLKLIEVLKKLPGVGGKSAERFAFHLLRWSPSQLKEIAETLHDIPVKLRQCGHCGCLAESQSCHFCDENRASAGKMCIIASPRDAFAIEGTREYKGFYHVLAGLLSPMEGIGPEKLELHKLIERLHLHSIKEVVIALDSTLEGDATALYLKQELEPLRLNVSRLAFGLPMGSSLDYVDGGTLARALLGRGSF